MTSLEKHHTIRTRETVLPHGAPKNSSHEKQRGRVSHIILASAVQPCFVGRGIPADRFETMVRWMIMIKTWAQTLDAQSHYIDFAGVPCATRRAGFME